MANAKIKPKKARERLSRRIAEYEKFIERQKGSANGFKRPGSLKK